MPSFRKLSTEDVVETKEQVLCYLAVMPDPSPALNNTILSEDVVVWKDAMSEASKAPETLLAAVLNGVLDFITFFIDQVFTLSVQFTGEC